MRRAWHANHTERCARHVGCDWEGTAICDACNGNAVDDWTGSQGARSGVEIWRIPDLHVEMIGSAGSTEASAPVAHGAVEEEDGNRVIIAGYRYGSYLGEGIGGRIEEFGRVLGRGVWERNSGDLTADDQDGAVGENDRVGEGASVSHGADGLHRGSGGRRAYRDDVGVGGGVGVLVVWWSTNREDFPSNRVKHYGVAAHGVGIRCSVSYPSLTPSSSAEIPVHSFRGTTLEDVAGAPAEQPAMVISAIDA